MSPSPKLALLSVTAVLCTACVGSSIEGDVATVRKLAAVEALGVVDDDRVDGDVHDATADLLKEPLDVERAVRVALLNNRDMRATLREVGIERGRLMQAALLPNPTFEVELMPERNTHLEFRAEYDLTRALLTPLRARAARADLEAARIRAATRVLATGVSVRGAFFRLQAAMQRTDAAERSRSALQAAEVTAEALREAGNVPALTVSQQRSATRRAEVAVSRARLEVQRERERLTRLLGLPRSDYQIQLSSPALMSEPELPQDLEKRVLAASLSLREKRQRLEALARKAGYTRTEGIVPDVSVDIHGLTGDPETGETGDGALSNMRLGAGVSVTLPLFDRNQGTARALDAEFDALMERYHGEALALRSRAREVARQLTSAFERAKSYQDDVVPAQAEVTKETLLQYNAMQRDVFDLVDALQQEAQVRVDYSDVLQEYRTVSAQLDALLAGVDSELAAAEGGSAVSPSMQTGGH